MATTPTRSDASTALADATPTLARMIRAMFPHPSFPDGPYERSAGSIVEEAGSDVRLHAVLLQGLRDLDAAADGDFAALEPEAGLEVLRGISASPFFEQVRGRVITSLYDDPEVWALLGYEGPSYEQGGYLHRGFDDLDWLPAARIEELS